MVSQIATETNLINVPIYVYHNINYSYKNEIRIRKIVGRKETDKLNKL